MGSATAIPSGMLCSPIAMARGSPSSIPWRVEINTAIPSGKLWMPIPNAVSIPDQSTAALFSSSAPSLVKSGSGTKYFSAAMTPTPRENSNPELIYDTPVSNTSGSRSTKDTQSINPPAAPCHRPNFSYDKSFWYTIRRPPIPVLNPAKVLSINAVPTPAVPAILDLTVAFLDRQVFTPALLSTPRLPRVLEIVLGEITKPTIPKP
mmetsp:Transcript_33906/g.133082  ORF Transcript_33906/g.133082 Transcript_33906/m.133082 type:complete len:206 (+) Transcript_33906:884-1501(+)